MNIESRRLLTTKTSGVLCATMIVALVISLAPAYAAPASGTVKSPHATFAGSASEIESSPLFAESLRQSKQRLDVEQPPAQVETADLGRPVGLDKDRAVTSRVERSTPAGGVYPNTLPTFDVTCYNYATCGATCGGTCYPCVTLDTSTCSGSATCGSTCSSTCGTCPSPTPTPEPEPELPHDSYTVGDTVFWPLWGADRFQTAVAACQDGWDTADTVVIATGRNWPDALGGAGLAGALSAPILLSDTNDIPVCTMDEISRLQAREAIILGGTGAVGPAAESELKSALGAPNVRRIGGANRYETAELVARAIVDIAGGPSIFSDDMSDLSNWVTSDYTTNQWGLSTEHYVSPPSSAAHTDYVDDETSFLDLAAPLNLSGALAPELHARIWYDVEEGYDFVGIIASIDGGTSWTVLDTYTGDSGGFQEIVIDLSDFAGEPSFLFSFGLQTDESNNSSDGSGEGVWVDDVSVVDPDRKLVGFVATGTNFPDALAAAPIAATSALPLLLSSPAGGAPVNALKALGVEEAVILGGTGVVSSAQESQLIGAFGADNVERLAGANRYSTAVKVATWGVDSGICQWNGLALATGENFPDALTGGALQACYRSVMMLTRTNTLSPETASALTACNPNVEWITFLGGSGAISSDVRSQVEDILKN